MKTKYKIVLLFLLLLSGGFNSCSLDIVPDEIDTEKDAFEDKTAAIRYVYSCYAYLPKNNWTQGSLDLLTGDEVVTAFEHETFAAFPKGNYTASNWVISYWDTFFQGLRQCYIFLNNVDKVPGLSESDKADYVAQIKFLIGYYHFMLTRCYGSTILITEEPSINTSPSDYLARTPYDECVDFICQMFDEAAAVLPAKRNNIEEYGLATSVAAKAMKAKMLLFAASPLFNGNSEFYSNFTDKEGNLLMPVTYDANKWVKAKTALKEAIDAAHAAGHALYTNTTQGSDINIYPQNPTVRCLRYNVIEAGNPEIIFAETRNEGAYGIQNKSMPYSAQSAWNGVAPTWNMLNRFYTKNGLPYDEDPEFKSKNKLDVVTVDQAHADQAAVNQKTIAFNLDREPRFYAWVAFQGSYYEVMSASQNGAYANDANYSNGRLICDFILGGNCSRGTESTKRTSNYSPTGYLNKKGVDPTNAVTTGLKDPSKYPWPVIRLADLYLSYAEACVETGDLEEAKSYLNMVRQRAGIPNVETSWAGVATLNQDKLREIVRQERMVEFYLENQNFWDLRRWKIADKYFGQKAKGMNIDATSIDEFARLTTVDFERNFTSPTQYLMPIPSDDVNRNEKLVNNPGY